MRACASLHMRMASCASIALQLSLASGPALTDLKMLVVDYQILLNTIDGQTRRQNGLNKDDVYAILMWCLHQDILLIPLPYSWTSTYLRHCVHIFLDEILDILASPAYIASANPNLRLVATTNVRKLRARLTSPN